MSIAFEIDHDASLIRIRLTDPLSEDEIARTVKTLLSTPALRPGIAILSDHSDLQGSATLDLVRSVVPLLDRLGERLGRFKCAVVVPSDASYGMAFMAEAFAKKTPAHVRAFRTAGEAEAWLNRDGSVA